MSTLQAEIYLHKMAKDDDNDEDMMSAKEEFYFVPNSYIQEPTKEDLQAAKFHAEGKNPSKCEPEPSTINESGGEEAIIDFQALLDLDLDPFDPNNVGVVPDENPNMYVVKFILYTYPYSMYLFLQLIIFQFK